MLVLGRDYGGTFKTIKANQPNKIFLISILGADYGDYDDSQKSKTPVASKPHISDEEEYFNRTQEKVYETIYNACDKRIELYVLNQTQFIQGRGYNYRNEPGCAR